jgi:hypothetical protein
MANPGLKKESFPAWILRGIGMSGGSFSHPYESVVYAIKKTAVNMCRRNKE